MISLDSLPFVLTVVMATLIVLYAIAALSRNKPSVSIEIDGLIVKIEDTQMTTVQLLDLVSYALIQHVEGSVEESTQEDP